ncbi:thermonuclease family protein [Saccharopolyspora shandongensis]|uniref:thermonuclease family protein n=2 Tax=Saccharopolyspora TaxID=1835 RepID=UPI0033FCBFE8
MWKFLSKAKVWAGVLGFLVVVGACNQVTGNDTTTPGNTPSASSIGATVPSASATSPATTKAAAPSVTFKCHSSDTVYDGQRTCHPGGELVTVTRVIDGDTLELAGSRRVRLLGVDAPEADTCAGPGATEFTRSKVQGQQVMLHKKPGVDLDKYGRTLAYIQVGVYFAEDLGDALVLEGWAKPYEGGNANPTYMEHIRSSHSIAEYRPSGLYGQPCGKPKVYGDDDGDGDPDYHIDVDSPHANLPDGSLTGGYCARKWWC